MAPRQKIAKTEPNTVAISEDDQKRLELAKAVLFVAHRSPRSKAGALRCSSLPLYDTVKTLLGFRSDLSNAAVYQRFLRWKGKNESKWEEMTGQAELDHDGYFADLVSPSTHPIHSHLLHTVGKRH